MRRVKISYFFLYLLIKTSEVSSITGPPPFTDWELGLRESVHQALLREHHTDPGLRDQLLEAPLIGRRDTASPFGDIAVLARGQLYITNQGFKFVQDSDQENTRCARSVQCQLWKSLGHHHKLVALWTVKRIRHRDPHYGHVFEIEYTISPITSAINEELVRRHGYFNYNVPGHIFIVKSNPRASSGYYLNENGDKWYKNPGEQNQDFKHGIVIGVGPDGYKHILHNFPGFYSSYHPHDHQTTIDPKEYELYKKLIESLASKTSKIPHRFSVTTPTQLTTTYFLQPTQVTKYSEPDLIYNTLQTTTTIPTPKPITMPVTTIHYYTPVEEISTSTATTPKKVIPTTRKPTTLQDIDSLDIFSTTTKESVTSTSQRTTVTELEENEVFPVNIPTEPMKPVTETPKQTSPDSITEQLPPPTVPYVSTTETQPPTVTSTTTQKIASTSVPEPREEITTVIEKIPYTEHRTTVGSTKEERNTTPTTTIYTVTSATPTTSLLEKIPSTVTQTFAIITEKIPSTTYTNPSTIFETTKAYTETLGSSVSYPPTTSQFPSTETIKFTFPTTTTQYYYTFDADVPKTSTITTIQPTQSQITTTNVAEESTTGTTITRPTQFQMTTTNVVEESTTGTTITRPTQSQIATTNVVEESTSGTTIIRPTQSQIATTNVVEESTSGTTIIRPTQSQITTTNVVEESTNGTITTTNIVEESTSEKTTQTTNDFLVDVEDRKHTKIPNKKDFNEDDIFGKKPTKSTTELPQTTTKRLIAQNDLAQALFGGRRSKQIKLSSKVQKRPVTETPRIIYNNFYLPATRSMATTTTTPTTKSFDVTTVYSPSTDQSYSTSISFEVNKKHRSRPPTIVKMYKLPKNVEMVVNTTESTKRQTKKVFDDLALQLVNHARSIDYLQQIPSRQPKYRRRNVATKKRSQRRPTFDHK